MTLKKPPLVATVGPCEDVAMVAYDAAPVAIVERGPVAGEG